MWNEMQTHLSRYSLNPKAICLFYIVLCGTGQHHWVKGKQHTQHQKRQQNMQNNPGHSPRISHFHSHQIGVSPSHGFLQQEDVKKRVFRLRFSKNFGLEIWRVSNLVLNGFVLRFRYVDWFCNCQRSCLVRWGEGWTAPCCLVEKSSEFDS